MNSLRGTMDLATGCAAAGNVELRGERRQWTLETDAACGARSGDTSRPCRSMGAKTRSTASNSDRPTACDLLMQVTPIEPAAIDKTR